MRKLKASVATLFWETVTLTTLNKLGPAVSKRASKAYNKMQDRRYARAMVRTYYQNGEHLPKQRTRANTNT